jgi:CheY-like chemotaxis protein
LPNVRAMLLLRTLLARAFTLLRQGWVGAPLRTPAKLQQVVFVGDLEDFTIIDELLEPGTFEVQFASSVETAYSEIARVVPDRVVLAMRADDEACLQLLAMLSLDQRTRRVPITTCVTRLTAEREETTPLEGERCFPSTRRGLVMH